MPIFCFPTLKNCFIVHARAENYISDPKMDCVITRAFSSLEKMLNYCHHLVNKKGCFLALKGKVPHDELDIIKNKYKVVWVKKLDVPELDANRCCVKILKIDNQRKISDLKEDEINRITEFLKNKLFFKLNYL